MQTHENNPDTGYRLVFIHGAGSGPLVWEAQTEFFAHSEAVTLPGHRLYEYTGNDALRSIDDYALWLNDYLHAEHRSGHDKHKVVLVGHSMGGAIALAYALKFGEFLSGLVLVGSGARMPVSPLLLEGLRQDFVGTATSIINLCFTDNADPKLKQRSLHAMTQLGAEVVIGDFEACQNFDATHELAKLTDVPTLIITGNADQMMPPKFAHFLADNIKDAKLDLVDAVGHNLMQEKPHVFNKILDSYLSQLV